MNLDLKEIKKIMYDFNRVSERLMHTDFVDFSTNVERFINFIDENEIIKNFIDSAGNPTFDVETEIAEVANEYAIFEIGNDEKSEVANIYAILSRFARHKIDSHSMMFYGYSHGSKHYQDMYDGFNSRVTMILISHIEAYLTKIGLDNGMDQRNINNNFYGPVTNLGLQQGNNNTMTNNIESEVNLEEIRKIIDEIEKNRDSFGMAFGEKADEFSKNLNELVEIVNKKEKSKVRPLLMSLKTIAEGAAGNLIATGVVALLTRVM